MFRFPTLAESHNLFVGKVFRESLLGQSVNGRTLPSLGNCAGFRLQMVRRQRFQKVNRKIAGRQGHPGAGGSGNKTLSIA
jgi:hypothetical protein